MHPTRGGLYIGLGLLLSYRFRPFSGLFSLRIVVRLRAAIGVATAPPSVLTLTALSWFRCNRKWPRFEQTRCLDSARNEAGLGINARSPRLPRHLRRVVLVLLSQTSFWPAPRPASLVVLNFNRDHLCPPFGQVALRYHLLATSTSTYDVYLYSYV